MSDERLVFNGINGATGAYLQAPLTMMEVAQLARGELPDDRLLNTLRLRLHSRRDTARPQEGIDPKSLSQTGWGVIFHRDADPDLLRLLSELLEHRFEQADGGQRFRAFIGDAGYHHGESAADFLARHGVGAGPADPDKVPYYLLIVGSPEEIPFSFQQQLDVQYAVGRLYLDRREDYQRYARSIVEAERGGLALPRRAVFVGTRHPNDSATALSADELIAPLATMVKESHPTWVVDTLLGSQTHKQAIEALLGGSDTPALLFTAGHGLGFPIGDPRQQADQGALLCQDWPGPDNWRAAIPPEHYLAAADVTEEAQLLGLITFHFACYSIGTPQQLGAAPRALTSALPQRLLSHPAGGALAVIGHVDRAWSYAFKSPRAVSQLTVFRSTLKRLLEGHPVGSALEYFDDLHAELSAELVAELERVRKGKTLRGQLAVALVDLWTAQNDARNYTIFGDPAVRLLVSTADGAPRDRWIIRPATSWSYTTTVQPVTAEVQQHTGTAIDRDVPHDRIIVGDINSSVDIAVGRDAQTYVSKPGEPRNDERAINAWIDGVKLDTPLHLGHVYTLLFAVDLPRMDAVGSAGGVAKLVEALPEDQHQAELLVALETEGFTIHGDDQGTLIVPRTGASPSPLSFQIEPQQAGQGIVTAYLFFSNRLFQKLVVTLQVEALNAHSTVLAMRASGITLGSALYLAQSTKRLAINLAVTPHTDGYRLTFHHSGVIRVTLNLSETQVDQLLARTRETLRSIVYTQQHNDYIYQLQNTTIPAEVHAASLRKLADLGYLLFQQLFYGAGSSLDTRALGDLLRRLSQDHELTIRISAEHFVFPWTLLYDRDPLNLDEINPQGFWGFKHVIEYMPEFNLASPIALIPEIMVDQHLELAFAFDQTIDDNYRKRLLPPVVQPQREFLATLPEVRVSEYPTSQQMLDLLNDPGAAVQLLYIYCHAESKVPGDVRDLARSIEPLLQAAVGQPNVSEVRLGVIDSYLRLSDGRLSLGEMYVRAPTSRAPLSRAPLVFINACQSAELSPYLYDGFAPYLLARGARGVLGTEVDTPAFFAAEFAGTLIQRFSAGNQPLGELLRDLRREYV